MGWLTNAATRESKLLKKLLGLSSYQLDSNGNVIGFLDANGLPMASKAVTWAEFLTLGSGDVQDRSAVWVYDKNCMFVWNDLAARWYPVGNGRLTFATFDLLPLPTANINGLCAWVESGIGIGGAWVEVRLIGAAYFWRYTAGRALVSAINADVLFVPSDGNYTTESLVKTFAIPLNNSKSLVQDGDFFEIRSVVGRTASVTTFTRAFRVGQANTVADTFIEGVTIAAGQLTSGEFNVLRRKSSTKVIAAGAATSNKWAGTSGSAPNAEVTVANMDSAITYLHLTLDQSANTNESVALKDFHLHLVHAGG